ncbi:MAG: LicD family protein [Bdellovibrionia bacterium]
MNPLKALKNNRRKPPMILKLLAILAIVIGVSACGYQAPLTAEEYDPENHVDHRIDLAPETAILELYQIMKDTHEVFRKCQLSYWADSGTALGAVRNNGIIPWDDDNDIAVSSKDVPQLLILRPIFSSLGYFIEKVFFGYRIVKTGTTAGVDIFLMNEVNGNFYYDRGDWGTRETTDAITGNKKKEGIYITREELFPLKEVDFGPVKVMIPNNPTPYLDANFRGWKDVAFTYGHVGQRKFRIDLTKYPHFKLPAPLEANTFQSTDIRDKIKNRISGDLNCPVLDTQRRLPFPGFFGGV